ncbi:MAG: hypothetical protein U0359_42130, partial [Byssovorax sp.]
MQPTPTTEPGASAGEGRVFEVAIGATFTADLIRPAVAYWLGELGIPHRVTLAGYGQLSQELLRHDGAFAGARGGAAVALVRIGDFARGVKGGRADLEGALRRGALDFISYAGAFSRKEGAPPLLVCLCPEPRATLDDPARAALIHELGQTIRGSLGALPGVLPIAGSELFSAYPVRDYEDVHADELGHIPYTPVFSTVIGTTIARKLRALVDSPPKVVAVDC